MLRLLLSVIVALLITIATIWINPSTDERAMYGFEGPLEQNWLPREVGGWPAPFLADNPNTSVIHKIGVEDNFRAGSFLGSLSFWLLIVLMSQRFCRWVARAVGASGRDGV